MIKEICHKNVKVYYYIFPPHNIAPLFYIFAFFLNIIKLVEFTMNR